jgi:hypothetical protein
MCQYIGRYELTAIKPPVSRPERAYNELAKWMLEYSDLLEEHHLEEQADEFWSAFDNTINPPTEEAAAEQTDEPPKKKWPNINPFKWRGGRKGD